MGLPWIHNAPTLPNNRASAMKRLFGLEKQFKKKPDYAVRYAKAINQYITLGHARHLERKELPGQEGKTWYLPHHGVEQNGKLRVVFDASSRHQGQSLNDHLLCPLMTRFDDATVWSACSLSGKSSRGVSRYREDV